MRLVPAKFNNPILREPAALVRILVQLRRWLDIRTLMVTHDWDEVQTLSDRITVLREG